MTDKDQFGFAPQTAHTVRRKLPVHPNHRVNSETSVLRVDGLVRCCLTLTSQDLERLPQRHLTEDFTCLEGWTVPNVKWSGVWLEDVIALAHPFPEARFVQASAGDFSLPLSREEASRALIATRLSGDAIAREHGGPIRLVVVSGQCFMQIKWLSHLELRKEAGENTARSIALGRLPSTSTRTHSPKS